MAIASLIPILIALGIGALIGLEREQSESAGTFAGIRTFPLIALVGALTAGYFPGLLPIAFATMVVLVIVGYLGKVAFEGDPGLTTAVASVLTFLYGSMTVHSETGLTYAIVLGTLTAAILAVKTPVHAFVDRIGREELRDALKFLIIAAVVLPLLPDAELDVLLGLNPRFVWLMVVFVSGLGFLGYVLVRVLGPRTGIGLVGLIGGFASSTATAVAMADQASREPDLSGISAFAASLASIAMLPRVLILVAVVAPALLAALARPVVIMALAGTVAALALWVRTGSTDGPSIELENPFRIRPALAFGAVFATVLLAVEWLNTALGDVGVYGSAAIAGSVSVSALTLSVGSLAADGAVTDAVAVGAIVLAVIVNTLVKVLIVGAFGTVTMARDVAAVLGLMALAGILSVVVLV